MFSPQEELIDILEWEDDRPTTTTTAETEPMGPLVLEDQEEEEEPEPPPPDDVEMTPINPLTDVKDVSDDPIHRWCRQLNEPNRVCQRPRADDRLIDPVLPILHHYIARTQVAQWFQHSALFQSWLSDSSSNNQRVSDWIELLKSEGTVWNLWFLWYMSCKGVTKKKSSSIASVCDLIVRYTVYLSSSTKIANTTLPECVKTTQEREIYTLLQRAQIGTCTQVLDLNEKPDSHRVRARLFLPTQQQKSSTKTITTLDAESFLKERTDSDWRTVSLTRREDLLRLGLVWSTPPSEIDTWIQKSTCFPTTPVELKRYELFRYKPTATSKTITTTTTNTPPSDFHVIPSKTPERKLDQIRRSAPPLKRKTREGEKENSKLTPPPPLNTFKPTALAAARKPYSTHTKTRTIFLGS